MVCASLECSTSQAFLEHILLRWNLYCNQPEKMKKFVRQAFENWNEESDPNEERNVLLQRFDDFLGIFVLIGREGGQIHQLREIC